MKICPNCQAEHLSDEVVSCYQCGYLFNTDTNNDDDSSDDSLDFIVNEASEESRAFIGEGKEKGVISNDDDLGIETTSDLMEQKAATKDDFNHSIISGETDFEQTGSYNQYAGQNEYFNQKDSSKDEELNSTSKLKKLSDDEIKKIEQNLYRSSTYLSESEIAELIQKIDNIEDKPFNNTPIIPPKKLKENMAESFEAEQAQFHNEALMESSDLPKPQMAKKGKGIAYFYKNYIQLKGNFDLMPEDELTINQHEFTLKPKKIKPVYVISSSAAVFVLLLIFIGSFFINDVTSNTSQIVGVALDEYDQPYIQGATIRLPETGKTYQSNAQGFFQTDLLPIGTYKIEYIINNQVIKTEYATISEDDKLRMIVLRPEYSDYASVSNEEPSTSTQTTVTETEKETTPPPPPQNTEPKATPSKTTTPQKSTTSKNTKSSAPQYGKIQLDANVEGAKLLLDGSVMGAGNLTYSKISSGSHNYKVSVDGYNPVSGTIAVISGETKKLTVNLTPMTAQTKKESFDSSDDYLYSGKTALQDGEYQTAIDDLTKYINKKPSDGEAYELRGDAYKNLKKMDDAHNDYLRGAEIFQIKKDYNQAITLYNNAIEADQKSIPAYLGRANVYLKKSEELAAIADFDKVRTLDKRNFQAYYGLGEARFKQSQYNKALEHFKDARSIDDSNPLVYQYMMLSYMAINDYKNVKKTFEKFSDKASEDQMNRFMSDQKYSAVLKIVETQ